MPVFSLLAFDLDGTLIDSDAIGVPDLIAFMQEEYGLPLTPAQWHAPGGYNGLGGPALLARLNRDFGVTLDFKSYLAKREARLPGLFAREGLPVAPGVTPVLAALHKAGQPICVASNSSLNRIKLSFQHTRQPLGPYFAGHFFSAVAEGCLAKPAPDVYLAAAAHFGFLPAQCLAVEDSPVGVAAGVSAGFTVAGYAGLGPNPAANAQALQQAGAAAVFQHWDDFLPLLAQLEA